MTKKKILLIGLVVALILLSAFIIFTKTTSAPEKEKPHSELSIPKGLLNKT